MRRKQTIWIYKGVTVYPADNNSSGMRWTAFLGHDGEPQIGFFSADTKAGIREMISDAFDQEAERLRKLRS